MQETLYKTVEHDQVMVFKRRWERLVKEAAKEGSFPEGVKLCSQLKPKPDMLQSIEDSKYLPVVQAIKTDYDMTIYCVKLQQKQCPVHSSIKTS